MSDDDTYSAIDFNLAVSFENCFVCETKLINTHWYCEDCWDRDNPSIRRVRVAIDHIPQCIPKHQHYRYIRRIYLGKDHVSS